MPQASVFPATIHSCGMPEIAVDKPFSPHVTVYPLIVSTLVDMRLGKKFRLQKIPHGPPTDTVYSSFSSTAIE